MESEASKNSFSVLMSVYAKENPIWMRRSLDSIFTQTLLPSEVILIEDGPLTPDLHKLIDEYQQRYSTLKVFPQAENKGLGAALNIGIKHCSNELVARMDTDDICKPNRFEVQVKFMTEHPDIDICSSTIDEFEHDIHTVRSQRTLPELHDDIIKYAHRRCPINHPTVIYKRSKVIEAGGYQAFPEDYILWINMIMKGCKFHNLQESLLWFRFSYDVYHRRGGWKYAKDDIRAQWNFYRMGFNSYSELITNIIARGAVRIVPNFIRVIIYQHILRKKLN
ncbi:glycosyltransferase family 2 protein [Prevotella melaninogenica]|uniref:glycosyltransferase family 2 protein n=1 Tax=Prevotella melaninogenica TaxID=28132 RepID=UPI001C5D446E|nr:glycosyltransferase [Prevotella melaninogenica]MBW4901159.1 glycosyltransferase [Prevotella melaninogenica]